MSDLVPRHRNLLAMVLPVGLAVLPPLAVYSPIGLSALFIAMIVLGALPQWRLWRWPRNIVGWLLPVLGVWMAVTCLWALDPAGSVKKTAGLATLLGMGVVLAGLAGGLSEDARRRAGWAAVAGVTAALALILMECAADGVFLRLVAPSFLSPAIMTKRGIAILVVIVWPVLAFLARAGRRRAAGALFVVTVAVVAYSPSDAGKLALVAASLAVLGGWLLHRRVLTVLAVIVASLTLAAPLLAQYIPAPQMLWDKYPQIKSTHHHRLKIWHFASERIAEHPVRGWGMDAARSIPGGNDMDVFYRFDPNTGADIPWSEPNMPLHPHNAALQWQLELGVPGLILMAALLAGLCLTAAKRAVTRTDSALLAATLSAAMVVAFIAFGAWQSWWISGLLMAASLWMSVLPAVKSSSASLDNT